AGPGCDVGSAVGAETATAINAAVVRDRSGRRQDNDSATTTGAAGSQVCAAARVNLACRAVDDGRPGQDGKRAAAAAPRRAKVSGAGAAGLYAREEEVSGGVGTQADAAVAAVADGIEVAELSESGAKQRNAGLGSGRNRVGSVVGVALDAFGAALDGDRTVVGECACASDDDVAGLEESDARIDRDIGVLVVGRLLI